MDPSTLKILQGAAGAAGDSAIGVEDVFKTYVYKGTGSTQTINNGIDLSATGGGLVWTKERGNAEHHALVDTERGKTKSIFSSYAEGAQQTYTDTITAFNSNGYTLGSDSVGHYNTNNDSFVSWTFKKQKKFFDIVTWTGDGTTSRTINHDLGSIPGCIMIKRTDATSTWIVYHRGLADHNEAYTYAMQGLDNTDNKVDYEWLFQSAPTATSFEIGSGDYVNYNTGGTQGQYIAYLFAHEEAEFGPNSDQKIISCGSYTGTGSAGISVTLPFEPQYLLIKNATDEPTYWMIFDSMRGIVSGGNSAVLYPNGNDAEDAATDYIDLTSTGFEVTIGNNSEVNKSGSTHFYIAIAAETGKTMKAIETGSDVFAMDTGAGSSTIPNYDSGFPVDFAIYTQTGVTDPRWTTARLIGTNELKANDTVAQSAYAANTWDSNVGWNKNGSSAHQSWMFRRHAGFDVQAVTTTGSGYQFLKHNLGVAPEMVFMKKRDGTSDWHVWHKDLNGGTTPYNWSLHLNDSAAEWESSGNMWGLSNNPDATWVIIIDSYFGGAGDYLMVLFSSVKGISHVGSYDGSSSSQTITIPNGGFQPRFVLIKRATGVGQWSVLDTTRGWGSGNDKLLELSDSGAQQTNNDWGAPTSTGFTVNSGISAINNNGDRYIYYAHA